MGANATGEAPDSTVTLAGADEPATRNALPIAAAARRAAAITAPNTSAQFAVATLRDEEAQTARGLIRMGRLIGLACLILLPLLGGSQVLAIVLGAAIVFAIVVGVLLERWIAGRAYSDRAMIVLACSVVPATFATLLYFGIFTAAQLFPAIAIYGFSRRERKATAIALFVGNAVIQAAFATLIIAGWLPDPGLFPPPADLGAGVLVAGHGLIQVGHLCAFLLGRHSHGAARDALAKTQHAMLLAAQHEALLLEARQDLDRALQMGNAGRFTDHVFGQFRLGLLVGRGGMGEVYEAWHVDSGEPAAVKLLMQRELGNPHSVVRFLREIRAVRLLASPHAVRVLAASEDGEPLPYFVMERLRGHDLAHHLRSGSMPAAALVEMLEQVGSAVEEAWTHGIVHRDIKPQNLMLADRDGARAIWKVLDFGVAALAEHSGTLTEGHVVGTPAYMAPEQARGERVDHRADVYSLAAIAYRWLTGHPVWSGRDLHASLYKAVHVMPARPSALAELDADIDAVLAIGLVKDPERRWQRIGELTAALRAALAGELSDDIRARAAAIVDDHPWGAVR